MQAYQPTPLNQLILVRCAVPCKSRKARSEPSICKLPLKVPVRGNNNAVKKVLLLSSDTMAVRTESFMDILVPYRPISFVTSATGPSTRKGHSRIIYVAGPPLLLSTLVGGSPTLLPPCSRLDYYQRFTLHVAWLTFVCQWLRYGDKAGWNRCL